MPAPTSQQFLAALKIAFINQGLVKRVVSEQSGALVPSVPPELTPEGLKLAQATADAISSVLTTWQATQVVTIPVTSTAGSPSTGALSP